MAGINGATGSDIINYKGDAAAGFASDPGGLSAIGLIDSDKISETAKNLALQSMAVNMQVWRQDLKERDDVYSMIDDDKLILENIPEEHRGMLEGEKQKIFDIFKKYNGDIKSDPKRYREFQGQIVKAKQAIGQSHKWYTWLNKELDTRSRMDNPVDQAKIDKHIAAQWKRNQQDFNSLPVPYAPLTHFDLNVVAAKPIMGTPVVTKKGDYDVTTQKVDPSKTFSLFEKNWARPEFNHQFSNFIFGDKEGTYGGFLAGPNADADVDRINRALAKVNADLGLTPADPNYVKPLGIKKDPTTGAYIAQSDRPDQIAAKIALADNPALVTQEKFAEDRVSAGIKRGQLAEEIRHNKATEGLNREQLALEKEKFTFSTKGPETNKNAAWEFASDMVQQLEKLGQPGLRNGEPTGTTIIQPAELRKMTGEQLRYLGLEKANATGSSSILEPLKINNDDAIQIENDPNGGANKIIRILSNARLENGRWIGEFDNQRTTTLRNIATNRLNEENLKSGSKERNEYTAIDLGTGGVSSSQSGGSTRINISTMNKVSYGGKVYYTPDGNTFYDASGNEVK